MDTNVYNLVWADDEIDIILDEDFKKTLRRNGFEVIDKAHNGIELKKILDENKNKNKIDAIIVDANFHESNNVPRHQTDTSGLTYARFLKKNHDTIPMFLFTGRTEDILRDVYRDNIEDFEKDFPRKIKWFEKGERNEMFKAIKKVVDKMRTPAFVVRNRFSEELKAAASIDDETYNFIFDFLQRERESEEKLKEIIEPFAKVRKIIVEKIFKSCKKLKLIPPIGSTKGTAYYFSHSNSGIKDKNGKWIPQYKMIDKKIMHAPLAFLIDPIVKIIQDGNHYDSDMKVDKFFKEEKDSLFLRTIVYVLIDFVKWYANTVEEYKDRDPEEYAKELWCECPAPAADKTENADAGNTNSTES